LKPLRAAFFGFDEPLPQADSKEIRTKDLEKKEGRNAKPF
jgi:hypothetical protein